MLNYLGFFFLFGFFFFFLLFFCFVFFVLFFCFFFFFFFFFWSIGFALRKHAYSNIPKILPPKNWNFQIKKSDIFHISAQNIDCGYLLEPPGRGGSNEYPQSMFMSRNKKNNVYPCKPQFYYIKVGLSGSKLYRHVFVMGPTIFSRIRYT